MTQQGCTGKITWISCIRMSERARRKPLSPEEGGRSPELRSSMKKKQLWLALALGLVLVLLCAGAALAATDALKFSMELDSAEFFEPKTINISFTVTNTGNTEMPGPLMLYYPDGKQVEEFGAPVLVAGSSKNWTGRWTVTEDELQAGRIAFKVVYSDYDENGAVKQYPLAISKRIQYKGAEPKISVSRTIIPQVAEEGQDVSIIYEITNEGPADVTNVTIQDTAAGKDKVNLDDIKSEQTVKHTFTVKMKKKDLTSQGTVTYKAGGKTYTSKADPAVIKFGKVNLKASLASDKNGGAPGETAKLTLTLKNSGTTDFTDVLVTDETLGIVFSGQTVKAGQTLTLEKELEIKETQDYLFTVRGDNGAGGQIEASTNKVRVIKADPAQKIVLGIEASADRNAVYEIPGDVRFTITVTNKSAVDVENVKVKVVDKTMNTFAKIPAGESRTFSRDTKISMAGTFRFTAEVKDPILGETITSESNEIRIAETEEPAPPTPTQPALPTRPPVVTLPPDLVEILAGIGETDPETRATIDRIIRAQPTQNARDTGTNQGGETDPEDQARIDGIRRAKHSQEEYDRLDRIDQAANTAKWILSIVAAVLLVLLLIGAVRRISSRSRSARALDHLEGGSYRNYSEEPRGRRRSEISGDDAETQRPAQETRKAETPAQNSDLMAETLQRLYARRNQESAAAPETPAAAPAPEAPETAAADDEKAEAPAERPEIQSASEAAHRRRARR